jgi:enamine deaminase RidA (YjgF/YER057c/UK114 family)
VVSAVAAVTAEERLAGLGIQLPAVPQPLGAYVPAVQSGAWLFVSGMLPIGGHEPQFVGRLGRELDVEQARRAARAAALNGLAVVRAQLGTLDRVSRVVRLAVSIATDGDVREHARVADAASELLRDVFGPEMMSSRLVFGVASLPLGLPVELELIFEVRP